MGGRLVLIAALGAALSYAGLLIHRNRPTALLVYRLVHGGGRRSSRQVDEHAAARRRAGARRLRVLSTRGLGDLRLCGGGEGGASRRLEQAAGDQ